jgi:hypothetical protein
LQVSILANRPPSNPDKRDLTNLAEGKMKKLTVALLVAVVALVPALAFAQAGGGTQAPSSPSKPAEKPSGAGSPGMGQGTTPGASGSSSPSASPPGTSDLSQFLTKADCEKAGGMWTESTKTCAKKR